MIRPSHYNALFSQVNAIPVYAKYPLISNLTDTVNSYNGTMLRSTTKEYVHDDLTLDIAAINAPAYTGSGVLFEPAIAVIQRNSNPIVSAGGSGLVYYSTILANNAIGPDGVTTNAFKITQTGADAARFIGSNFNIISIGQRVFCSGFIKKGAGTSNGIKFGAMASAAPGVSCIYIFNVDTGTATLFTNPDYNKNYTSPYAKMTPLANGWFHIYVECVSTVASGQTTIVAGFSIDDVPWSGSAGDYWYMYNMSFGDAPMYYNVNNSGATANIPTSLLTVPSTGWSTTAFSVYMEFTNRSPLGSSATYIYDDYVDANNKIQLAISSTAITAVVTVSGVSYSVANSVVATVDNMYKILLTVQTGGNTIIHVDGTSNSASAPMTIAHAANVYVGNTPNAISYNTAFVVKNFKFFNHIVSTVAQAQTA